MRPVTFESGNNRLILRIGGHMEVSDIVFSIATFFGTYFLNNLSKNIQEVTDSVKDLNKKMAIIIERTETHNNEIQILRQKHDNIASDVAHIKAHLKK
jgi:uncharacterized protein YoxC